MSLIDFALNMIDLTMDEDHGGWWDRAKAFYQIETRNGGSQAAPMMLLSLYRLTGNEGVYRRRAVRTLDVTSPGAPAPAHLPRPESLVSPRDDVALTRAADCDFCLACRATLARYSNPTCKSESPFSDLLDRSAVTPLKSSKDSGRATGRLRCSAHRQADKLLEQARRHRPAAVAMCEEAATPAIRRQFTDIDVEVHTGPQGLVELATRPDVDVLLAAVVGAAGLPAVLAGVRAGKTLALANKESLVVAGSLVMAEARRQGVSVLPVDSEHSAVFQAMQCGSAKQVSRIILTASGGPFRCATKEQIESATLADALNHPTWRMGTKITIDSATMFNKGLEIIEACWLFDIPPEKVEVVVHPDSIVHSMVEFVDGSVLAQLSPPDMRTPIQYALTYPERG